MIFTRRFTVSFVMLLAMIAFTASAAFAADMFSGTWKLNLQKSVYNPGPAPKDSTVQKIDSVANGIRVMRDSVGPSGQKIHQEYTVKFDGKDYPFTSLTDGKQNTVAPTMISAKKVDDSTIEFTLKTDGKVTVHGKWVFSRDGKTLTWTHTLTTQGQSVNNTMIYEKQ